MIRKENSSIFVKGNIPWNKGLTKETDERVKKNEVYNLQF